MNVYSKHDIVKCKYLLQWEMCLQSCSYTNPCDCDKASCDVTDSVTSPPCEGGRAQPTPSLNHRAPNTSCHLTFQWQFYSILKSMPTALAHGINLAVNKST